VPDEDHVVLGLEDGSEVTVAFEAIREAVLAVDWEMVGKRR
jgi:hypothetical protein